MDVKVTDKGLFISEEQFEDWGEIEVIKKGSSILIKPKSMTRTMRGRIKPTVDVGEISESYRKIPLTRMREA